VIPALATFIGIVGKALGWELTDMSVVIITAFGTFLGTILGVSTKNYKKSDSQ